VSTEFVLLLGLYAFILLGAFLGERGPIQTFQGSAPRLAAKVERDLAVGKKFQNRGDRQPTINWSDPQDTPGGAP
jgi:hypothetical protein